MYSSISQAPDTNEAVLHSDLFWKPEKAVSVNNTACVGGQFIFVGVQNMSLFICTLHDIREAMVRTQISLQR